MKWGEVSAAMICVSVLLVGCGPEIEIQNRATTGTGGSGGDGGAGTGGTAGSGGGNALGCKALIVQSTAIAVTAMAQSSPQIALDPSTGHLVYTFLNGPNATGASLYAMTATAFDTWPPSWTPAQLVDNDVRSYAMSNGPLGPVGIVRHVNAPPKLIDSFLPQVKFVDIPLTDDGDPQFVTAIIDRYFWGSTRDVGTHEVSTLSSYQPGSIPQSEDPLVCAKPRLRSIAQPSNSGFLAAMLEPNPPNDPCDPINVKPATVVSISRYDSDSAPGSSLKRSPGWQFTLNEPVVNLAMAKTSDGGAWVAFQTDGSTSEVAPGVVAARATPDGYVFGDGALAQISPQGVVFPTLVATSLHDTLVAGWIDSIDPSAPVIIIQLQDWAPSAGLSTSIPTNDAWYDGDLQLLASNDKLSVVVAWTSQNITAFARVDCLP